MSICGSHTKIIIIVLTVFAVFTLHVNIVYSCIYVISLCHWKREINHCHCHCHCQYIMKHPLFRPSSHKKPVMNKLTMTHFIVRVYKHPIPACIMHMTQKNDLMKVIILQNVCCIHYSIFCNTTELSHFIEKSTTWSKFSMCSF